MPGMINDRKDTDGQLVLVASKGDAWLAWRFNTTGATAVFAGVAAGPGKVLDQPAYDHLDLRLPIVKNNKLDYVNLSSGSFHGGGHCASL
jgi:hypothetical protein